MPPGGQPPHPATPPKGSNRRRWIIIGAILILLLGGCGALAVTGAIRGFQAMTAPVDVANDYLDAAREEGDTTPHTCGADVPPPAGVVASTSQDLTDVSISGGRARVNGTVTLADAGATEVRVTLTRGDGEWCVTDVAL